MDIGTQMTDFNDSLMASLTSLRYHRLELQRQIDTEEKQRTRLQLDIEKISYKLASLNKIIAHQTLLLENYDRSIAELEAGYRSMLGMANELLINVKQVEKNLGMENSEPTEVPDATSSNLLTSSEVSILESTNCSKTRAKTVELMKELDELQAAERPHSFGEKRTS